MRKFFLSLLTLALCAPAPLLAQTDRQLPAGQPPPQQQGPPPPRPPAPQPPRPAPRPATLDLSDYGVTIGVEPRLVVVMSALDAAGFDPAPNKPPTVFRARIRQEHADLDANFRARLRRFYELNRLKDPVPNPAHEAARFVSLAFALGPPPSFDAPARGDETLFAGVLDVLDFAPLVAEYFRKSGIEERLPVYLKEYQTEGDRMRRPTADMVRSVLNYLHTRPSTAVLERTAVRAPGKDNKKGRDARPAFETRERDRRFVVVPDLLAVPGAINFRVVGDDYFVVVPAGADPSVSDVRRAYVQYVIDPLVLRYNRDIALKRPEIRALLDERQKAEPGTSLPDVFRAVANSIVVAADARMTALARTESLSAEARARLPKLTTQAERDALTKEVQGRRAAIEDETTLELADAYERGAVLAFHFAEALRDQESAGFDFADSVPDLVARIDPARELRRPAEYAEGRTRALAARERARTEAAVRAAGAAERTDGRRAQLIRQLDEVGRMLQARNYPEAETRLLALMGEYRGEPRIFYTLGQTFSVGASDATAEAVRDDRLRRALANYRFAIDAADRELDRALLSRAYVSAGRILAFLEQRDEAVKMFDAAVQLGEVPEGAYRDAVEERKKLQ